MAGQWQVEVANSRNACRAEICRRHSSASATRIVPQRKHRPTSDSVNGISSPLSVATTFWIRVMSIDEKIRRSRGAIRTLESIAAA